MSWAWVVEVRALEPDLSQDATDTSASWQRLKHAATGEPVACETQGEAEAIARDWLAATRTAGDWLSPPRWEYHVALAPS